MLFCFQVHNIVSRQLLDFRKLYKPYLEGVFEPYVTVNEDDSFDGTCRQDMSSTSRFYHLSQLPHTPITQLAKYWRYHASYDTRHRRKNVDEAMRFLSHDDDHPEMLQTVLNRIVFRASAWQSLKGIFSAGLSKSILYSRSKIQKMVNSQNQTSSAGWVGEYPSSLSACTHLVQSETKYLYLVVEWTMHLCILMRKYSHGCILMYSHGKVNCILLLLNYVQEPFM